MIRESSLRSAGVTSLPQLHHQNELRQLSRHPLRFHRSLIAVSIERVRHLCLVSWKFYQYGRGVLLN